MVALHSEVNNNHCDLNKIMQRYSQENTNLNHPSMVLEIILHVLLSEEMWWISQGNAERFCGQIKPEKVQITALCTVTACFQNMQGCWFSFLRVESECWKRFRYNGFRIAEKCDLGILNLARINAIYIIFMYFDEYNRS